MKNENQFPWQSCVPETHQGWEMLIFMKPGHHQLPIQVLLVSGGGTCPVISLTQQRSSPNPIAPPRTSRGKRTPGRLTKPPHSIDSSGYEIDVGRKRPIACATPSSRRDPTSLKCNIPPNTLGWENPAPIEATSKPGTAPSGETPDSRTVHWTSRNQ